MLTYQDKYNADMDNGIRIIRTSTTDTESKVNEIQQSIVGVGHKIDKVMSAITKGEQEPPIQKVLVELVGNIGPLLSLKDELQNVQPAALSGSTTDPGNSKEAQDIKLIRPQRRRDRIVGHCGCRYRRRKTKKTSPWSIFTYFDESVVEYQHEVWCTRYHPSQERHERTRGVTYMGFHRLLNIALVAAFTRTSGAGGGSISPMLKYVAVVDSQCARSFRIVDWIVWAKIDIMLASGFHTKDRQIAWQQVTDYGLSKLKRLFSDKCASPTDIDQDGKTLISIAVRTCKYLFHHSVPIARGRLTSYVVGSHSRTRNSTYT